MNTQLPHPGSSNHWDGVGSTPISGPTVEDAESTGAESACSAPVPATYALVRAMEDVMAKRHEQIFKFGHTPVADLAKPLRAFALDLEGEARGVLDDVQFRKPVDRIRRRLVKLAALALATIDRIDNEGN
ncbi:hypothetical protein [Novosphingobium sp. FKTRR1]|uniref:hypothetical protein n=1 Tax=Novosphingobium sp. FKTRR1 TaxID=2879118 RepID=UPI001CF002DB|nr:hypothetical protein [Novosphingobium sp. FKTRR1]